MKVLHVGKYFSPIEGGIESINEVVVDSLKGNCQRIISYNNKKESIEEDIDFATVIRTASIGVLSSQPISLKYFFELRRYIKMFRPDVVHLHYPNPLAAFFLLLIKKKYKLIVHWHSDIVAQNIIHKFITPIEEKILKNADLIIATSPNYLAASKYLQKYRNKVTVIPCSINETRFQLREDDQSIVERIRSTYDNKPIVFFIGRHVEYKGLVHLLEAEKLIDEDCVVLIAGQGPLTEELRERYTSNRIKWLGRLSDAELKYYYHAASLFAFPSITRNEAFGVVLAEAMYCNCPAVTFTIEGSGVNWVSINGETGIEVPNGNSKELAKAIDKLLKDPNLRIKYANNARKRVESLFTSSKVKDLYKSAYATLLK